MKSVSKNNAERCQFGASVNIMKLTLFVLASMTAVSSSLYAQEIKKCDGAVVLFTENNVERLTERELRDFLLTFGKECQNNVEYSEFSNEVLFLLLGKQTELILKTIEKEENRIELEEVLRELSSPVSDMIEIKSIISKVEKVKIDSRLKKRIVEKLRIAESSGN